MPGEHDGYTTLVTARSFKQIAWNPTRIGVAATELNGVAHGQAGPADDGEVVNWSVMSISVITGAGKTEPVTTDSTSGLVIRRRCRAAPAHRKGRRQSVAATGACGTSRHAGAGTVVDASSLCENSNGDNVLFLSSS